MITHRSFSCNGIVREQRFDNAAMFLHHVARCVGAVERPEYLQMRMQPLDRLGNQPVAAAGRDQAVQIGVGFGETRIGPIVAFGDRTHVAINLLQRVSASSSIFSAARAAA